MPVDTARPIEPSSTGAPVELKGIHHSYGSVQVLAGVDLSVAAGEFVTLLGPSGSGKTTLLRIVGGLVMPTAGIVTIGGDDVTSMPARHRGVGFVFQSYALFPHMNVYENVAFPLRIRKIDGPERDRRVTEALELVELAHLAKRAPAQLSGGQQQRVALARALVFHPRLVLLDEPLGSLDKRLREQLQTSIRLLQLQIGFTAIYVTHDQDEAFALSDRIIVVHQGSILRQGSPEQIYRVPGERFVASFVGDLNELTGTVHREAGSTLLRCPDGTLLPLPEDCRDLPAGTPLTCGVRPEQIHLDVGPSDGALAGVVKLVAFKGSTYRVLVDLDLGASFDVELRSSSSPLTEHDRVWLRWDPEQAITMATPEAGAAGTSA